MMKTKAADSKVVSALQDAIEREWHIATQIHADKVLLKWWNLDLKSDVSDFGEYAEYRAAKFAKELLIVGGGALQFDAGTATTVNSKSAVQGLKDMLSNELSLIEEAIETYEENYSVCLTAKKARTAHRFKNAIADMTEQCVTLQGWLQEIEDLGPADFVAVHAK